MSPELPPPDTESWPSYISEEVHELIFSDSKERRAVITEDTQGLFRVHTDYWCLSDFDYIGEGYWVQDDHFATITDTIENARKLAREALHKET